MAVNAGQFSQRKRLEVSKMKSKNSISKIIEQRGSFKEKMQLLVHPRDFLWNITLCIGHQFVLLVMINNLRYPKKCRFV